MMNVECRMSKGGDQTESDGRPREIKERTFEFACRVIRLHRHVSKACPSSRDLCRQLLRSATSVGANLEEAHAGQSKADFIAKASIALKEARETLYWLRLLSATEETLQAKLAPLVSEANEVVAVLTAITKKAQLRPKER